MHPLRWCPALTGAGAPETARTGPASCSAPVAEGEEGGGRRKRERGRGRRERRGGGGRGGGGRGGEGEGEEGRGRGDKGERVEQKKTCSG